MRSRAVVLATLALGAASVHAASWTDNWYVLGSVSHSSTSLDKGGLNTKLQSAGATGVSSADSGTGNYQWRLQLGYRFNDWLALEGGYIDLGKAKYNATYAGGSAAAKWKAGGPDLAVLGILPVNDSFSLFGKLGVIDAKTKTKIAATGAAAAVSGKPSDTHAEPIYGLGAMYKLTDNAGLRLEYERVNNVGDSVKTGKADVDVVSLGLSYQF